MKKVFILLSTLSLIASCSVIKSGTSKSIDIVGEGVIHVPVVTELDIQTQKQQLTKSFTKVRSMKTVKNDVIRELLINHNANVLVEPTYDSETKGGTTIITVKGWPAKDKNFRNIEEKDHPLFEVSPAYLQKATTTTPSVEKRKKKFLVN